MVKECGNYRMPTSVGERFKPSAYIPVSTAAILLVGSSTLFFVFTCPWLVETISLALPLCIGITFLFVLANFTMATFMDPGVLPRANEDEDKDDDFRAPLYKNVEVKSVQVRMKWCASCHFYRPPRCSHCSVCDHCVEDFDHHCPWVNNCIGRRNYRYFFLFLLSLSIHMVGVFSSGLLYVLHHLEDLWEAQAAVTLVVMSVSGLFFIPVVGLACFHMVLVARGRTTNEQVTGKFQGGVNPFTRGCCGNVEYVLCSPTTPRYTGKPSKKSPVRIQPPFLRPGNNRQTPVKVRDNGIQSQILPTKRQSTGGLDVSESKRLNTPPPLPPKPDPVLLKSHLAALEESLLHSKMAMPSAQTTTKLRPTLEPKLHYHVPREQIVNMNNPWACGRAHDYSSEPNLGQQDPASSLLALQAGSLQMSSLPLNSRSLSLRHAHCRADRALLPGHLSEGLPSQSTLSPNTLTGRSSSLSYDSLLCPGEGAPQRGMPLVGYQMPFLTLDVGLVRGPELQRLSPHARSPVFAGLSRQSPQPREPSPVRYDNLSKAIMASIQERRELEEREKLPRLQAQPQALYPVDLGVYDTPSRRSLPPEVRPPYSRGPTPPAYGSREFLMSSAAYGYGGRGGLSCSSSSSLSRAPRTSSSSLQPNPASAVTQQGHSLSPSYRSLDRQSQRSPSAPPTSSYATQRALSFITTRDSAPLGGPKYES